MNRVKFEVHNCGLHVGNIRVSGVSSSSVFLIGDNESIALSSIFDTPPESVIYGPLVPLSERKRSKEKRKDDV
ncbi:MULTISPECIES: spore gernimation protein GerPD [Pontibacillus]|uniref:Spore gernimation protein GerPD n=1 Tax=Pontibacillus chungwhensis TaxID=265426 RepID=A0ABY8V0D7_9BACI|nr:MULTISPECIES: spore gernimation protein GerPD [Pontibacillus]MCD5325010.1 spore gernimation protein GerPD [Pontibacillus sp. HN14]WIF98963.1 spore gernimation protein GerPD [Pontibacillus chungwhensis]